MSRSRSRVRPAWGVVALCVVALAVAAILHPAPTRIPPPAARTEMPVGISYGNRLIDLDDARLAAALDDAVALHASWIRMDFDWSTVQPNGPQDWRVDDLDRVVKAARQRGLKVLAILTYTPAWARAAGCERFHCPPADSGQFAAFAGRIAGHFGARIEAYEIWNEPNHSLFWSDPDPQAYGQLLHRSVTAIRTRAPQATLLFGGLAALSPGAGRVSAAPFLEQACAAEPCDVDAVAIHPYGFPDLPSEPGNSWQRMSARQGRDSVLTAMRISGLADRPLWVTEFGAPTGGAHPGVDHVSEQRQADLLVAGLRSARRSPEVFGGFFVYTDRDLRQYDSNEDHFGLSRSDGTRKPAFTALQRELAP